MAYDEVLVQRLQDLLDGEPGVTERKMFGGWGFMVDGKIAVAAGSTGDLMVRVDREQGRELTDDVRVRPMQMKGRTLDGWLLVSPSTVADARDLAAWVGRGVEFARSLPPKQS